MSAPSQSPDHMILRRYVDRIGLDAFALRFELNRRTAERIYSGARPCPARLLATVVALEQAHG